MKKVLFLVLPQFDQRVNGYTGLQEFLNLNSIGLKEHKYNRGEPEK
jgi:hypothetical protein